jgi:subtilisin family serine protease
MQTVVVLRDLQASRPAGPFRSAIRGFGPPTNVEMRRSYEPMSFLEPSIEIEDTDSKGRAQLLTDPGVAAVTTVMPTRLIEPTSSVPAPRELPVAWGIEAVKAADSKFSGLGVSVAIVDTGIEKSHSAFAGVAVTEQDFSGDGDGDRLGHGTHCAGTILGQDVDGVRIGVARGVSRALVAKVLADDGKGSSDMLFRGFRWAAEQGADVISMSLGFDFPGMVRDLVGEGWPVDLASSSALEAYRGNLRMFDALMAMTRASEAFGAGAVVVAAAGNESRRDANPDYAIAASLPAAADGVVSVGAAEPSADAFRIGSFSNTFPRIAAPGVWVTSAKTGGGLTSMSGTSMACPHVAGVAALWWEAIRAQGLPPRPETVVAKLLAEARADVFEPGVSAADRGTGLVTAP